MPNFREIVYEFGAFYSNLTKNCFRDPKLHFDGKLANIVNKTFNVCAY